MQERTTLVFGAPEDFGFSDAIKDELTKIGYHVVDLSKINNNFKYPNLSTRIVNLVRKTFLKDKKYKSTIRSKVISENLIEELDKYPNLNYALFIRPDLFPLDFFKKVKNKFNKIVGYHWDGIDRYAGVTDYIPYFTDFYVFDPIDLKSKLNVFGCTNFYLPHTVSSLNYIETVSAYSINSYQKDKIIPLTEIKNTLESALFPFNFIIYSKNKNEIKEAYNLGFKTTSSMTNYQENLRNVLASSLLIDVQIQSQSGLSFRIFESIGYEKKLITTNKDIENYEFYDPNNILIWNNQSPQEFLKFYHTPYKKLPKRIKEKYALDNWIKFVLKSKDFDPISLPKK
ncbi:MULTISPECIES: hypothetical protein [Sphingobacterium]|uniref:hypothetical protein n=1 Tax=Sphingobacterium TaxID=28453 RepID=UPI00257B890B|nr:MULTISPECIES: hypothetical protein [Sphingobacterium]